MVEGLDERREKSISLQVSLSGVAGLTAPLPFLSPKGVALKPSLCYPFNNTTPGLSAWNVNSRVLGNKQDEKRQCAKPAICFVLPCLGYLFPFTLFCLECSPGAVLVFHVIEGKFEQKSEEIFCA